MILRSITKENIIILWTTPSILYIRRVVLLFLLFVGRIWYIIPLYFLFYLKQASVVAFVSFSSYQNSKLLAPVLSCPEDDLGRLFRPVPSALESLPIPDLKPKVEPRKASISTIYLRLKITKVDTSLLFHCFNISSHLFNKSLITFKILSFFHFLQYHSKFMNDQMSLC